MVSSTGLRDQAGSRPSVKCGHRLAGETRRHAALPLNDVVASGDDVRWFDLRLYVNGTLAGSTTIAGAMAASIGVLRIGGNSVWGEWFAGLIDEVRVYNRALSAAEVQQDMQTAVGGSLPPPDTSAPSAPSGVSASTAIGSATLGWTASSDNVGVVRYNVHRSQTAGLHTRRREPGRSAERHQLHRTLGWPPAPTTTG